MVSKKTRICCTLLVLNFLHIDGFETDKCDHQTLTIDIGKLHSCRDSITESMEDICGQFEETRECVASNLDKCFHQEDIKKTTEETMAFLKGFQTRMLLIPEIQKYQGFILSKAEVNSLFSVCTNVPDKTYKGNLHVFFLKAGVRTDNNCTEEDITDFNTGSGKCLVSEHENTEAQLGSISADRGCKQSTICPDFDRVVGNCLRKTSPSCFSMRERSFLRRKLVKEFQYVFKKANDLLEENWFDLNCSVFSGCVMTNPSISIAYIVFSIPLFYVNIL